MYRELAAASPDRYRPDLARTLDNLGVWFFELGRPAEALPASEEAVAIRRELAAASPDRYRPDLAQSLDNLAEVLAAVGRKADADSARNETAELCARPDR
jgi:tetratricopeptide (TPR) repeat protein